MDFGDWPKPTDFLFEVYDMGKARIGVRILLGVAFVFFGLNGFMHFFTPPPPEGAAGTFMAGLAASGYVFPVMSLIEIVAGLLLVAGRAVPLALTLLAPILVNILGFHVMMDLKGIGAGAFLTLLELFLVYAYWPSFHGLFTAKTA